jgi:hypothetical protein
MRTFWNWALALVVPAVWVAAVRPADLPVPEGTVLKLLLLRQKSVQKELECSKEVCDKIMKFTKKEYDEAVKAMDLSGEERKAKFEAFRKANRKFLTDTLSRKQLRRLDQITLQLTGLTQLTRPEIIKRLELTDDQVKKFKELQKDARKRLAELIDAKGDKDRHKKLAKLREETRKKIMAELTDEQKEKVRKMVGEPFKGEIVFENTDAKDE